MAGRHSKLTDEVQERICEALRAGNTRRAAARYGGIDEVTLCRWVNRYANFANAIKKAESDCEVRNVAVIERAAFGYPVTRTTRIVFPDGTTKTQIVTTQEFAWQAAAWWLERRLPDDYKQRQQIDTKDLTDEQLLRLLATAAGGPAAGPDTAGPEGGESE